MLTRLSIKGFKRFKSADIELGQAVVFVGPNNSGKTTALQALALWRTGLTEWHRVRADTEAVQRPGVTVNRRALTQIPVRETRDLFSGRRATASRKGDQAKFEVAVAGQDDTGSWELALRFQYANPESLRVQPARSGAADGSAFALPEQALATNIAFLPPMSGLVAEEPEWAPGRVDVLIGEGQTAQVLRNLCLSVHRSDARAWGAVTATIERMFGVALMVPEQDRARGTVELRYVEGEADHDISAAGRGLQQVLLLLAHLQAHPGAVLVLDEPDAHLEVLRQREVYQALTDAARRTKGQIIAASHSEILLNEAADRDMVVAFVGVPHRIDDRGAQVLKALKSIPFDNYLQAEQRGWVLYLEGPTDLAILLAWARRLGHPAEGLLTRPFLKTVANNYREALSHFFGLREAKRDLRAFALFDRPDRSLPAEFSIPHWTWRRREIENYLASPRTLRRYAVGDESEDLFGQARGEAMDTAVKRVEAALTELGRDPWGADIKASEDVLPPIFKRYYMELGVPDRTDKSDFHVLASAMQASDIDPEIVEALDALQAALAGTQ